MKKSNLRAAAALQALALMGAGVATAFIAAAPAAAQDYTSGSITGTVTDENGNAVSGASVTLLSKSQGFTQTTTSSGSGNFRFSNLTTGAYDVTVKSGNSAPFRAENVSVLAGQTADLNIGLTAANAAGSEIVVLGSKIQAFTGTTTGLNVDVAELVKTVPVNRSLTGVILLAPGTSRGDTAFGNLASVGGSSVAENAYYVNGLNTTNFDNYLGSAQVPFDMYKSVEVKSGGYPAEFGRATGGIVNATTKTGTNDFMAAAHISWNPDFLNSHGPDLLNCSTTTSGGKFCDKATNRHYDRAKSYSAVLEAGGPIFRDRLFVYGLVEFRDAQSTTISRTGATAFRFRNNDPFWGVKLDAYPIDDQHFELTVFDTRNTTVRDDHTYNELPGLAPIIGVSTAATAFRGGGLNYVGKYTGRFTDWFTISAAYGRMRDRFDNQGLTTSSTAAYSRNLSGTTLNGVTNGGFFTPQRVASTRFPYATQRKFYRADVDIYASLMGDHHFRAGIDVENNTLNEANIRNGGAFLFANGYESSAAFTAGNGGAGYLTFYRPADSTGQGIVEFNYFNSGGAFNAKNDAIYLQDEWKVTDRLTANLGIRRDNFRVDRADGKPLTQLKNNWAPRIGLTYDLFSDKRGKIKAFYGQYYLPFASNTAFRNAGAEYFFRERYYYSSIDANGQPVLTGQVTNNSSYQGACPFPLTNSGFYTGVNCSVTGDGSVAPTNAIIDKNLKATKEAEWLLGYEHKIGRWRFGVNGTHRKLLQTAEDVSIDAAVNAYCAANSIAGCPAVFTGFHQYVIVNPGYDVTVTVDGGPLDGQELTFTAAQLGYPKATRTYDALDFTFERPYDGVWSFGGSYTWSKSKGNSEGFVQSDFGQTDAGITQDFDSPGFTDYAYGYLPNDRRHRLKLYGAYTFDDAFTIGANYSLQSPRSLSCFGFHPTDAFARIYGAASHFCDGKPSPRGTAQKSDWISNLDLKFAYKLKVPTGQNVTFRADIFNVINSSSVEKRYEFGDLDVTYPPLGGNPSGYIPDPNYGQITGYQTPRSVRLGMDISF